MNLGRNKKSISIRNKLTFSMSAFMALFVFIISSVAYYIYSTQVNSNSLNQIKSTSEQVQSNYETYFETVISASDSIQVHLDNVDVESNKDSVSSYFDGMMDLKSDVSEVDLYDLSGKKIVSCSTSKSGDVSPDEGWFTKAKEEKMVDTFSRVEQVSGSSSFFFSLAKYISFNKGADEGVLRMQFDFSKIITLISQTDLGDNGHITIYDKDYGIVYSSFPVSTNELSKVKELILGTETFKETSNTSFVLYLSTIQYTTWKVAIITNNEATAALVSFFLKILISVSVSLFAVFLVFIFFLSKGLTSPLRKLSEEMSRVETLNYDVKRAEMITGSKEIEALDKSFIQMMERIKELMEKVVNEQEAQRKSELKALQNQINPHFLYNTLDSIIYLIDEGENEKAEKMILALSKFFRISISKGKTIIPLPKEIEHVENYLIIQKMRYGDAFMYSIDVEKGLEKYFVIKLILQPIVENAIAHGINEKVDGKSIISIKAFKKDDLIVFQIRDNGYGILPDKVQAIYESFRDNSIHNGVGLQNVYQRIKVFYGEKADVKIDSNLDKGTTITIVIPEQGALKDEE